ncbi:uncharacterized protein AMSG_05097 [Thecamonas trahens ATCC 50062]|uniref:Uncharacterized protein n=1 Tax=Thecamonas trahens ATCC 50062 TaxID=461836 RepID=A0A0L0D9U6_THETB|nr:hypothetical protein AMSG_05097 [Thecamonas trahens ATCC 50062]KNC49127.1 hypothetical protein AMSG_05097 [Thecamonas trahens ATCC 50062]|eukprot:XP_013758155.1 hypothetical protein AMSG_05097 [Thecamonas trahens ATCC 50062]
MAAETDAAPSLSASEVYEAGKRGEWDVVLAVIGERSEAAAAAARFVNDAVRVVVGAGAVLDHKDKDGKMPIEVAKDEPTIALIKLAMDNALAQQTSPVVFPPAAPDSPAVKIINVGPTYHIAYGGGVTSAYNGRAVWLDEFGRVLVGWHGTVSPPSGMAGEDLMQDESDADILSRLTIVPSWMAMPR